MFCPQCGQSQPIAELCIQCGAPLMESGPVTVTEHTPTPKGLKALAIAAVICGLLGGFWFWQMWKAIQEIPTVAPIEMQTPTPATVPDEHPAPSPLSLQVLTQVGQSDPGVVRALEVLSPGHIHEIITAKDMTLPEPSAESVLVVLGDAVYNAIAQAPVQWQRLNTTHAVIVTASLPPAVLAQKKWLAVSTRPDPLRVAGACKDIFENNASKQVLIIYNPATDEEYATALYGAWLDKQFRAELVEVKQMSTLQSVLRNKGAESGLLAIVDTPSLDGSGMVEMLRQQMTQYKTPIVVIGPSSEKFAAVLEISGDQSQMPAYLLQAAQDLHEGKMPSAEHPWLPAPGLVVRLHTEHAKTIRNYQAEILAGLYKRRHPDTKVDIVK